MTIVVVVAGVVDVAGVDVAAYANAHGHADERDGPDYAIVGDVASMSVFPSSQLLPFDGVPDGVDDG